jgi:Helix-turn-helix domain
MDMSGRETAPLIAWRHGLLSDERLSWRAKYVALALSAYWDGEGQGAYPSVETLAHRTVLSDRSVQRGLRELEKKKIIRAKRRPGRTTTYHARGVSQSPPTSTPPTESHPGVSDSHSTGDSGTPEVVSEEVIEGALEQHGFENREKPEHPKPSSEWRLCAVENCLERRQRKARGDAIDSGYCKEHSEELAA